MIENRDDLMRFIAADLQARRLTRWRAHYRITQRIVYFQWLLRRSEYWRNCRRDPLGRVVDALLSLRLKMLGERLGYSIPRNTFGPGLSIAHVGTIVINQHARIGARCRIHHGVTIGADAADKSPVIGDDVHLSPNASIIGDIRVGDQARVFTGAVVTKDVPARADAAGVPAKVVCQRQLDEPGADRRG